MECSRIWWIIDCVLCLRAHASPFLPQSVLIVETRHVSVFAVETLVHIVTVIVWRRSTSRILAPPPPTPYTDWSASLSSFAATVQMVCVLLVVLCQWAQGGLFNQPSRRSWKAVTGESQRESSCHERFQDGLQCRFNTNEGTWAVFPFGPFGNCYRRTFSSQKKLEGGKNTHTQN